MDAGLGQLFDWLKAQGRFERTLIVVTADHGESFTHGYGGHGGPLLSEDLLWIPCLIKPPFHHGPERDSRLFEQVDLEPTMLQMVGLPEPRGLEGVAMARKPEGLPVFSMNHDYQLLSRSFSVAVRLGNWKYVEHFGHWTFPWPKRELYDLAVDPAEDHNLAEIQPDRATALRGLILAELAKRKLKPDAG
jgi:arylsulfatase A-like enzyme